MNQTQGGSGADYDGKCILQYQPITQYDFNGNIIKQWDCVSDAIVYYQNYGISLAYRGKRLTATVYIWKRKEDPFNKFPISKCVGDHSNSKLKKKRILYKRD